MAISSEISLSKQIHKSFNVLPVGARRNTETLMRRWPLGTLCSGADTCVKAFDCMARSLEVPLVNHKMSCDIGPTQRLSVKLHGRQDRLWMDVNRLTSCDGLAVASATCVMCLSESVR